MVVFLCVQLICFIRKKSFYELVNSNLFTTHFDESKFPCKGDRDICSLYEMNVSNGYKEMKKTDMIVSGLVKDSQDTLPVFIERINSLQKFFKSFKVVLFENDSKDDTRRLLLDWEKEKNFVHIIKCNDPVIQSIIKSDSFECKLNLTPAIADGPFSKSRFSKMVKFRNILLEKSKQFVRNPQSTTILMIDTDLVGPFSIDGIAHSFGHSWDMISSYGITGIALTLGNTFYYDLMAYKDSNTTGIPSNPIQLLKVSSTVNGKQRGDPLLPVLSSFAGFAIYKYTSIKDSDYSGDNLCEHINLHDNMISKGFKKLYINPSMIVLPGLQSFYEKYPFMY